MKKIAILILGLSLPVFLAAQTNGGGEQTDSSKLKKMGVCKMKRNAKKLERKGSYLNAVEYYEAIHEKRPNKAKFVAKAAELNHLLRDYKSAEKWYGQLLELDADKYPLARYNYALMQKYNGKYDDAITNFNQFKGEYDEKDAEDYKRWTDDHIKGCELGIKQKADPIRAEVKHLGKEINSPFSDYGPKPMGANGLMYSGIKSDTAIAVNKVEEQGIDYRSKLRTSEEKNGQWMVSKEMEAILNNPEYHNGNGAFSPDGKRFFFTRCKEADKLNMRCDIWVSKKENGAFQEPESLSINGEDFTTTQPYVALNKEGKEVIFFSSNRPKGKGGRDIWYAEGDGKGGFGAAKNAGDKINTDRDEITPFYNTSTGELYFSSDGHINIGGYDIFKSVGYGTEWGEVENIGYPVNSSTDDMYFVLKEGNKNGFLVSNRPGVFSLKSETCCDDIFTVKMIYEIILKSIVATKKEPTTPLEGADVSIFKMDGDQLTLVANLTTKGNAPFTVPLEPGNKYQVTVTKPGYWGSDNIIDLTDASVKDTLERVFFLEEILKIKLKIKRVYFAYDRYNIIKEYLPSLDSLYDRLSNNPDYTIAVTGHTDHNGSEAYNMKLAKRRAQACADYLMEKGINVDRISLIAKGEVEPLAPNTTPSGKDDPLGRAKNRRVEFQIKTNEPTSEFEIEYFDIEPRSTM